MQCKYRNEDYLVFSLSTDLPVCSLIKAEHLEGLEEWGMDRRHYLTTTIEEDELPVEAIYYIPSMEKIGYVDVPLALVKLAVEV